MSVIHENQRLIRSVLIGTLSSIVLILLLICLFGLILQMISGIPYGIIDYVMIAIQGVGVLTGAYIGGAIAKGKGLIIGALCAGITLLIILACGMSVDQSDITILTLIRSVVLILCGLGGAIAGVNRRERVRIK